MFYCILACFSKACTECSVVYVLFALTNPVYLALVCGNEFFLNSWISGCSVWQWHSGFFEVWVCVVKASGISADSRVWAGIFFFSPLCAGWTKFVITPAKNCYKVISNDMQQLVVSAFAEAKSHTVKCLQDACGLDAQCITQCTFDFFLTCLLINLIALSKKYWQQCVDCQYFLFRPVFSRIIWYLLLYTLLFICFIFVFAQSIRLLNYNWSKPRLTTCCTCFEVLERQCISAVLLWWITLFKYFRCHVFHLYLCSK